MQLERFMDGIKATSEEYAKDLPSDGDWEPMLLILKGGGFSIVGFEMPENGNQREHLFLTTIPNLIQDKYPDPDAVVILVSTWFLENYDPEGPMPSESPDRKEALVLHGISREKELSYFAEIKRSDSAPELEWMDEDEMEGMSGRLVGSLRRAVWT